MTSLLKKFLKRVDFDSYEDFKENFELKIPKNFNFGFDVVDEYAKIDPNKLALVWCDDNEEKTFTFKQISKLSNQAANFYKNLGIKKGDTVMLTLKNRYEWWINMVALHKLGAIAVPATHMLKLHDIDYRINNAEIKMVVTVEENYLIKDYNKTHEKYDFERVIVGNKEVPGWYNFNKEIMKMSDEFEKPSGNDIVTNDDTMLIYFTSGTSGEPKMVSHTPVYALAHIVTAKYWQDVVEEGLHHTAADTGWGKAVWGNLYGQWIAGTAIFIYDYVRFNGLSLIKKVLDHHVTTFCGPPTIYRFLIKEDLSKYDFSNIKHVTTAGEPLPPEVFKVFKKQTGLSIKEGFGQTETTLGLGTFIWLEPKLGSVGKPSPLYNLDILDKDGQVVDIGSRGELTFCIDQGRPAGLFKEYFKNPEQMKKKNYDGHYHSGDTVWVDEDGYYHFEGRNDDIIKSSGYRIGPYEVESAVISHPSVLECAITGVPHEVRGQVVKATIVLTRGYTPSDELAKEIQNHVKKVTAPYKYPRVIEFVDELPKTISGKIKRNTIRGEDINKSDKE
ncbi:AMP-binding protein [Methanobrevibacter acididurans]|uniref:AMP-binding protein n=1 Tax=Methanobrevibacter acididurans TaxID=120963 RepID=UPI0038FD1EA6